MMLLTATRPAELPTDALLARLRGRRAVLRHAAETLEIPATNSVSWVYSRLNRHLRHRLKPFLDLLAMRNLVLALRYTLVGEVPSAILLNDSLLDEPFKKLLTSGQEPEAVISQLESMLIADYPFVAGLTDTYRSQGPGGIELQLADGIMQHGVANAGASCLKRTMRYLVDMRNVLLINKLWRWQVRQVPRLGKGGELATTALKRTWAEHDDDRLTRLVAKRTGLSEAPTTPIRLEQTLLNGLTLLLHRGGRDPLGLSVIIEYLWLGQVTAHNRLLRQTLEPDREALLEEVLLI